MTALLPSDPAHSNHLISTGGMRARRVQNSSVTLLLDTQMDLTDLCRKNSRQEVCGFLTDAQDIHLVKNSHQQPRYNYYMELESLQEVVQEIYQIKNQKIMGIFHTHPNNQPWPSPRDIAGWPNRALKWHYFIATNKEVIEWELYVP